MSVDVSNHELMKRIKNSDHYAFTTLYNRLWESHYTKAFSLTGNKSIAQDTVQEVWISFWERRDKIQNDNIEGYLIKAIRFKVYSQFRNSVYRRQLIEEFVKANSTYVRANNVEQSIQLKDTEESIFKIVDNLPKKCKEVFKLSRFEGLKNEEIAQKLNISKRTVETHISNALKVLKNNVALGLAIILELYN